MAIERLIGQQGLPVVVDGSQLEFSVTHSDFHAGFPQAWAVGLAAAEKAFLWKKVGGVFALMSDQNGPLEWTAIRKNLEIRSAGDYGITKDVTLAVVDYDLTGVRNSTSSKRALIDEQ